jgi:RNA polymerase sigma-70 factor, ECF subfamily
MVVGTLNFIVVSFLPLESFVMTEIPPVPIPGTGGKKGHPVLSFFGRIGTGMTVEGPRDISGLIAAWGGGDEEALSHLVSLLYPELRRIARKHLGRRVAGHTLESAALANEAYLKLVRAGGIRCENRVHFLALCSQIIRRILVDHARGRGYAKRGGDAVRVPLDEVVLGARARGIEVLALDEALESLSKIDARKGHVVELRYFGGLSVEETAEVMGISPETVKRDWKMAKAWLFAVLTGEQDQTSS